MVKRNTHRGDPPERSIETACLEGSYPDGSHSATLFQKTFFLKAIAIKAASNAQLLAIRGASCHYRAAFLRLAFSINEGTKMKTLQRSAWLFLLLLWLGGAASAQDGFYLKNGDRVVFYGASITDQRRYTTFVETYVVTRFPTSCTSRRGGRCRFPSRMTNRPTSPKRLKR